MGVKVVEEVAPHWTLQCSGEFEIGVYLVVVFGTGLHGGYDGGGDDDIRDTWVEGSAWPVQWGESEGLSDAVAESVAAAELAAAEFAVAEAVAAAEAVVAVESVAAVESAAAVEFAAAEVVVAAASVAAEAAVAVAAVVKDEVGRSTESVGSGEFGWAGGSGGTEEPTGWAEPGVCVQSGECGGLAEEAGWVGRLDELDSSVGGTVAESAEMVE